MAGAYEVPGLKIGTLTAAADLSTHQFKCVKMTSTGINVCGVAGEGVEGILQNKPAALGQEVELMCNGISKAVAGAAITKGAQVMTDASGRVITAATAGSKIIGVALEAAANAGEIIPVLFSCPARGVV